MGETRDLAINLTKFGLNIANVDISYSSINVVRRWIYFSERRRLRKRRAVVETIKHACIDGVGRALVGRLISHVA